MNIRNHTDLNGGIITSTQAAEDNGKNSFHTKTLAFQDIENHSHYDGKSVGVGGGFGINGKGSQNIGNTNMKWAVQGTQSNGIATGEGLNGAMANHSMGYGSDSDSQNSITKSGINTKNIKIDEDMTGEQAKAIHTDNQQINQNIDRLKADKEAHKISEAEYNQKLRQWQMLNVGLNMVASGLSAPTQSGTGIAAATLSPALSYEIGQYFKGLAQNNGGKLSNGQEAAHIFAHAVLGAATAAAGGNDALAGALSAGGAEAAAPVISHWLYGTKDAEKLTAEQKDTVTAITRALGTSVGAAVGGNSANAMQGSLNADSAVNNNFNYKLGKQFADELRSKCVNSPNPKACSEEVAKKYDKLDKKELNQNIKICQDPATFEQCRMVHKQNNDEGKKLYEEWQYGQLNLPEELSDVWYRYFITNHDDIDHKLFVYKRDTAATQAIQNSDTRFLNSFLQDTGFGLGIKLPIIQGNSIALPQSVTRNTKATKPATTPSQNVKPLDNRNVDGEMAGGNRLPRSNVSKQENFQFNKPTIFYRDKHGKLTDGKYTVELETMKPHQYKYKAGKSIFYGQINSEQTVLEAARYADKHNLWIGNKAKIRVETGNIGILGDGTPTNYINIYRNHNGFIHGSPGTAR